MTTALSVYKPWGLTADGARRNRVLLGVIAFFILIALLHLFGVGLHGHSM
jgi:hypothetical protein